MARLQPVSFSVSDRGAQYIPGSRGSLLVPLGALCFCVSNEKPIREQITRTPMVLILRKEEKSCIV